MVGASAGCSAYRPFSSDPDRFKSCDDFRWTASEKRQSAYEEQLVFMQDLTPGDFATVKRQYLLLSEELSPDEWLSQLELEVKAKHRLKDDNGPLRRLG